MSYQIFSSLVIVSIIVITCRVCSTVSIRLFIVLYGIFPPLFFTCRSCSSSSSSYSSDLLLSLSLSLCVLSILFLVGVLLGSTVSIGPSLYCILSGSFSSLFTCCFDTFLVLLRPTTSSTSAVLLLPLSYDRGIDIQWI